MQDSAHWLRLPRHAEPVREHDERPRAANLDEQPLELQRVGVDRGDDDGVDARLGDPPEGPEVRVLAHELPPLPRGEGHLPHALAQVEELGRGLLGLAAVEEELDALGVDRQPGREDQLDPVRVARVRAEAEAVVGVLLPRATCRSGRGVHHAGPPGSHSGARVQSTKLAELEGLQGGYKLVMSMRAGWG